MKYSNRVLYIYDLSSKIPPADAGHDFSHIERVASSALKLFSDEILSNENREITIDETDAILTAALLHD